MADYTTTWVVLCIYLAVLLGILASSQVGQCRAKASGASSVETHYLAGRQIPSAFLALTTVASVFSGYTVTGLPAEAYSTGFSYIRWVGLVVPMLVAILSLAPRMVFLGKQRGYISVLDVVRDRFTTGPVFPSRGCDVQGSVLHWLATATFFVPAAIYLLAQFISFSANLHALSNGTVPKWVFGLFFFLLLATFEAVGGLRAVVLTDVFQGGMLLLSAPAFLIVQYVVFGGLEAASAELALESPSLLLPPAGPGLGGWLSFALMVGPGRVVFPDILTRFVAAGGQHRVRITAVTLAAASFVVLPAMGLIGIHGRALHGGGLAPNSVFTQVCLDVVESGWAGAVVGSLLLASSQAAIMSTADSVLMEVGKLMSLDVCLPVLRACGRESDERTMLWLGRAMTFLMAGLCWLLTGWGTLTMDSLSSLLALQNVFGCALAPTYLVSMYSDACPAWLASLSIVFGLVFGVLAWALNANPETTVGEPLPALPALVLVANFAVVAVMLAALRRLSPADPDAWEHQRLAICARDAASQGRTPGGDQKTPAALPRPAVVCQAEGAPRREPIHRWQALLAAVAAMPLLLPYGGAGTSRTWGVPDWSLAFLVRMLGLSMVLLYLVLFRWGGPERDTEEADPEASCSLAASPVHATA